MLAQPLRILAILGALTIAIAISSADEISVGQQAPPLGEATFVKGGEPLALDAGTVSVVELWATWCGPCRTSIPHLTQLQKQHGDDVQIIGITREDVDTITPFVEEMGDEMDYFVASAPEGYDIYAQGVRGIPFAYIIDGSGTVVWKGHPMGMDDPLAQIIAGTFDGEREGAISQAREALEATFQSNDLEAIAAANEALLSLNPTDSMGIGVGIRLAEINEDRAAFRALFQRTPDEELTAGQAGELLSAMLSHENPTWIEPARVSALATITVEGEAASTGGLLAAARAHHFLGNLEKALSLAEQASEANEPGAQEMHTWLSEITALHQ
ncbi:MAG: TlpA family protein disulfide reductase [Planctomycetota bacterium]|nr:MAG: TlpA family protein disulfide reductase [Planctomycetota bacterium]